MIQRLGRFLTQGNRDFPADCEMLDYMQTNLAVVSILGNIVGDKAILSGCELEQNNTRRRSGYVFLKTNSFPDGEIIYWEGGAISGGIYLKQDVISVSAQGYEYSQAYVGRSLAPGIGLENYKWEDFSSAKTPKELEVYDKKQDDDILKLAPQPLGIVQLWAGIDIPQNYALCDGQYFRITDYPDLHAAIGTAYNNGYDYNGKPHSTIKGYFRLPDLRGRFVVGYNASDSEYSNYGKIGGEKKHILSIDEMPAHQHGQNLWASASEDWGGGGRNSYPNTTSWHDRTTAFGETDMVGSGLMHENRPPFYTLAYIMRLK